MSTSEDHEGLANELEHEADRLKQENDRLEDEISGVRSDWESKRQDPGVPGATPPADDEGDEADESRERDQDRGQAEHPESEDADSS